jgi:hexosaminidase
VLRTLSDAAGMPLRTAPPSADAAIRFEPAGQASVPLRRPAGEAYALCIAADGITICADSPAGHFNGLQTLAQLLRDAPRKDAALVLPCLDIEDHPRFAWRGFMLDESRHFSGKEAVLRLVDAMANLKLNRLHWHLTDSPAWRIEIKAYPRLTEIGARGSESDRRPDAPAEFYTQEDVREIVAFAQARNVVVVPEIDMPGHADAAVLAYPELDGGGFERPESTSWPRFTFNPANPATLKFLDTVLKEVAALFPNAGVIHFGGDEVRWGWDRWPDLPDVQALMAREGLADLAAVEAWFNRRMAASITALGFRTGGWDEIAGCGLPASDAVVFWWRHDKPEVLRRALDRGYPVVLCPRRPCYLDFVQHDSHRVGRRWDGFNTLEDVYRFPRDLGLTTADEAKVLGVEACLWTETMVTQARRDFMTWPRLVALAEAAWTLEDRKDYTSFMRRLPVHHRQLAAAGIAGYDVLANSPESSDDHVDKPKSHLD